MDFAESIRNSLTIFRNRINEAIVAIDLGSFVDFDISVLMLEVNDLDQRIKNHRNTNEKA